MSERYDVIQHVKTANGAVRWVICSRSTLRAAQLEYDAARGNNPTSYFELLHIVHTETCVAHTGTAQHPLKPGDDEGEKCNVGGCEGTMEIERERCYCNAIEHPPCGACETTKLVCNACEREV